MFWIESCAKQQIQIDELSKKRAFAQIRIWTAQQLHMAVQKKLGNYLWHDSDFIATNLWHDDELIITSSIFDLKIFLAKAAFVNKSSTVLLTNNP